MEALAEEHLGGLLISGDHKLCFRATPWQAKAWFLFLDKPTGAKREFQTLQANNPGSPHALFAFPTNQCADLKA